MDPEKGHSNQSHRREERKAYHHAYRQANREEINAKNRAYYQAHREEINAKDRAYRQSHREQRKAYEQVHREQRKANDRAYKQASVSEALKVLGNQCSCPGCGVAEPLFLTIDHIHGRRKGEKRDALKEAKASGWDKSRFQVLCMNCNFAKGEKGFCPVHQQPPASNGHLSSTQTNQMSLWSSVLPKGGASD